MALIGSITNWGEIQGQINDANGVLTGVISSAELLGGEIVGMRGLKGDKGDTGDTGETGADGQDGYSPSASVSKVGDTATITITDKDGTTTADVYDGDDGNVFIVELGETTYQEVVDAADDGAIVLLPVEIIPTGEKQYYPLVQIYNHRCVFVCQRGAEIYFYLLNDNNSWDSQTYTFITTETDPTVPSWAKQATKPTYTASEVGAQETLVSGTNIKTINNTSLLGSGNIDIQGGGGASAFIAEYGVTTYADIKDAYDEDAIILCAVDDSGNTVIHQLVYFDDAYDGFVFASPTDAGWHWASIVSDDTWDDGYFHFASTDTATQLRDGLMTSSDKTKLDGIASGAEVNVQSDWNEADSTADDYIKNKPSIHNVPSGGSSGQVLSKSSGTDYDVAWSTPSGGGGEIAYCECTDSASTVAKTASVVTGSFTSLTTGALVAVKFTYTNTATDPTLNVAGTGAKAIMRGGTAHVGTNTNESWGAGTVVFMLYDGSVWNIVGWLNTTYTGGTEYEIEAGTVALNKVWSPQQIHNGIVRLLPTVPTVPKMAGGQASMGTIATNSYEDKVLDFTSYGFTSAPHVTATLCSTGTAGNIGNVCVDVHTISKTGATIRVFNNRGSSLSPNVEWIAIET